jgi:hypothetical protein
LFSLHIGRRPYRVRGLMVPVSHGRVLADPAFLVRLTALW